MLPLAQVAARLEQAKPHLLAQWRTRVDADPQVRMSSRLSRVQFNDHIPVLLDSFGQRLRHNDSLGQSEEEREVSEEHSRHRWQQGYDLRGMVREWGHLNATLVQWFGENEVPVSVHLQWAEFVAVNEAESVSLYEELLQSEAHAKLRDVQDALEQLQQWDRARGELLREASHDLRGSLSVVVSASGLLGHPGASTNDRSELSSLLMLGVRNITSMMNDLLDMGRLEAGIEKREVRAVDAGQLLGALCTSWRLLAEEKGIEFAFEGPQTLWVEADPTKVRRIAQNLTLNAIKYTKQGEVHVVWGEEDETQWFIEIVDSGEGLEQSSAAPLAQTLASAAPDAPDSSFEPQPAEDITSGEGIGLAIVRRLCEMLDASIDLHSTDEGSTFRVTFPREYDVDS